jgi:hypothetical protein
MGYGGRPSKYTPEILEKTKDYVAGGYLQEGEPFPMIAGLALVIGVSRDTCFTWANDEDKPEFSDLIEALMAKQEKTLSIGGITNEYNSTITKLMLGKHGYSDKVDTAISGELRQVTRRIIDP